MAGLIAVRHGRLSWPPLIAFLGMLGIGMAAGAAFGASQLAEVVILLSLPMLAGILLVGRRVDPGDILPMLALFAFAHGFAHGSAITSSMSGLRFASGAMAANGLLVLAGVAGGVLFGTKRVVR
jgi:urease accessory protein